MTQNLNHYEKILSRSHSNYLAQISIEMTDANNQINDVLSKLTALGTVLIPMNLGTGLWGMNVHVPGEDDKSNVSSYVLAFHGRSTKKTSIVYVVRLDHRRTAWFCMHWRRFGLQARETLSQVFGLPGLHIILVFFLHFPLGFPCLLFFTLSQHL